MECMQPNRPHYARLTSQGKLEPRCFRLTAKLVTQGCNEVPKAFGGTYWDIEKPDHRDITKGHDPNELHKREILRELVERLRSGGFLSTSLTSIGSDTDIVSALIAEQDDDQPPGVLRSARINDLTEYGRVVHAEMLAICDAARVGEKREEERLLYCTTFPCHNCTKHIIASGIRRSSLHGAISEKPRQGPPSGRDRDRSGVVPRRLASCLLWVSLLFDTARHLPKGTSKEGRRTSSRIGIEAKKHP